MQPAELDLDVVRHHARRAKHDAVFDEDDAYQEGCIGLLEAARRYQDDRGAKLSSFASQRISGQIVDARRRLDPISRGVRVAQRDLEKARDRLEQELGRTPTEREIQERADLPTRAYARARTEAVPRELDRPLPASPAMTRNDMDSLTFADTLVAPEPVEADAREAGLPLAMGRLSERERLVIGLMYWQGLRLWEIGELLEVTESRVCQIHTKALKKLRLALEPLAG